MSSLRFFILFIQALMIVIRDFLCTASRENKTKVERERAGGVVLHPTLFPPLSWPVSVMWVEEEKKKTEIRVSVSVCVLSSA